jgi:hypothetical protein
LDWEWIKQIAFGALNLSHDVFWKLTPKEFLELYDGWKWRQKQHYEEMKVLQDSRLREYSLLASWIISPIIGKRVKATDLYDPERIKQIAQIQENSKKIETPTDKKMMLEELEAKMGVK